MSTVSERAAIVALVAGSVFRENGMRGDRRAAVADAVQTADSIVRYAVERYPVEDDPE